MPRSVFRDYDQASLDVEYNNREKVKDSADWLSRYAIASAELMSTDWSAFGGLAADVIKAGCGISGLYDLEPIRLSYLNEVLKRTPESARRNGPVHCPPARSGPLLLPVGGLEGAEYHRQGGEPAGSRARRSTCPGTTIFSILAELEDPGTTLSRLLRQMGFR
jgi:hypothetical protein